jgi:hypothetical protein
MDRGGCRCTRSRTRIRFVDLQAQDLDIVGPHAPKRPQEVADKICSSAFSRALEWVEYTAQAISSP